MRQILVGYDGSEAAGSALDRASELANFYGCPLTVLTAAADRLDLGAGVSPAALDVEQGRAVAEQGAERARKHGVLEVEARISAEAPDDALVMIALEGYDLVVVGHRGRGALEELFLGSTAKAVVDRAHCAVLVAR